MPNVLLQYTGKRLPLSLKMPWLVKPLTWDRDTGRTLEVDSGDAERLSGDGDGTIFVVMSHSDVPKPINGFNPANYKEVVGFLAKASAENPEIQEPHDLEEKPPPDWYKWLKNEGKVPIPEIPDSPDVGGKEAEGEIQCPHCDHKPYKRKDFYDKHIADKHSEPVVEVENGDDNGQ